MLVPLVLQCQLRGQEPWAWKGGNNCPIYKGRGTSRARSSFRACLLSDDAGNLIHRTLRARLQPKFMLQICQSQHGGVSGRVAWIGSALIWRCPPLLGLA